MKTIGVAISDALGLAANPLHTIERKGTARDVAAIQALCAEYQVEHLVVGWPLELSGKIGPRAKRVQVLIDALRATLPQTLPIETWDERFTTVAVERVLVDADLSRRRRKEVIDKQAAAYILQGWLDARQKQK
jgi:putative Holliday junction resolvase